MMCGWVSGFGRGGQRSQLNLFDSFSVMKQITAVFLALVSTCAAAVGPGEQWLYPPISSVGRQSIASSMWREVPVSLRSSFEEMLSEAAAVPLKPDQLATLQVRDLSCAKGSTPYLIRAVSENRGTGAFSLESFGDSIVVVHSPLGRESYREKNAIVVCLAAAPSQVYPVILGAL